jgi:hypothetical protein
MGINNSEQPVAAMFLLPVFWNVTPYGQANSYQRSIMNLLSPSSLHPM